MCPVLLYSCLAVSSPYHQLISAFHSCTSQSLTPGVNQAGLFHWHMTKKNQLPREKRQKQRSSFLALGLRVTIFSEAGSTIIRWIAHLHCPPESVGSVFFSLDFVLRKILPLAARRPLEAPSAAHMSLWHKSWEARQRPGARWVRGAHGTHTPCPTTHPRGGREWMNKRKRGQERN